MPVLNVTLTLNHILEQEIEGLKQALLSSDWTEALAAIWISVPQPPEIAVDEQPDGYPLIQQARLRYNKGPRLVAGQVLR